MSDALICLTLGKTGVGKSSFINAITGKQTACKVSGIVDAQISCTKCYDIIETQRNDKKLIFIDTPGLKDPKGDEDNIKEVAKAIVDYPYFRAFLILLKFDDNKMDKDVVSVLTKYMEIFPIKDFWKHTIIIRTHAKKKDEDFEDDKKKIENAIVNALKSDDLKEFKTFMQNNNIDLPYSIQEFYVNNNNAKFERTLNDNKDEFDKICEAIGKLDPLFKKIIKIYEDIKVKYGDFEKIIHKLKLTFYPDKGDPIYGEPFILSEEEISKLPLLRQEPRYEYGPVRGKCGKKEILRYEYVTKIYNKDGKEIRGSECLKRSSWISKKD